jgi:threonine/homoserine/homoserine lactone efflux protein
MATDTWLTFIIASLILTMTPGPSILLGMLHSMKYGVKQTSFTALGDISANFIQMIIVAAGLGVVIASSDVAFTLIKWFGVITLVYMGVKMLFDRARLNLSDLDDSQASMGAHKLYMKGFLVAAGNPKAIVFFTAFFPQFIDATQPLFPQLAIMCPTMAVLDFTCVMLYALSAKGLMSFLQEGRDSVNRFGGLALLGAAIYLSISSSMSI